jgi:hypothetical protein
LSLPEILSHIVAIFGYSYVWLLWVIIISITFGYYNIDYFWVLLHQLLLGTTTDPVLCQQAYSSKILYNFYFKLYKFLCNFILFSCIYSMLLAQKKPGPGPLVCSE